MPRSNTPSACSLPPSNAPDQPGPPSNTFATRDCSSRAAPTSVLMLARFIGCLCNTTPCSKRCAILAMREPSAVCRTHTIKHPDGSLHIETLPQEQWLFLVREVHAGYL